MELTQENVEKLNVAKMPDAPLCKGLLLDAIEAGDALEKELSNLRQDYRKISELYIAEQNKCGHLEARIKELESIPHTDNTSVIDALQKRIKELEEVISKMETTSPKWISTKDSLPKEGEEVIVFYTSWKHEYQQVAIFESGEFIDLGGCALSPTHWMPLPPPPITKEI